MKKLLMGLMVVGVLVSTPSLCGETWSLGKVTVDKLYENQTGGLDSGELKKNHIEWVRIVEDVFGNPEVWTDSLPDVSGHAKAKEYCPIQCAFLGLDWNGGYGQYALSPLFNSDYRYKGQHYSHCGCTDIEARKAAGVFIDYGAGGIVLVMFSEVVTDHLVVILRDDSRDQGTACNAIGQNQWQFDKSRRNFNSFCKRIKPAQEKIPGLVRQQQEIQQTVDTLMEPVKALQKK